MGHKKIILLFGPTASGKSRLALDIAKKFNGEIVNADSMQIYKEIKVLSAKPEDKSIKHHLYGFVSVKKNFSVGLWYKLAAKKINEINKKDKIAIVVGGTGLYFKILIDGLSEIPEVPTIDMNLNPTGRFYMRNSYSRRYPGIFKGIFLAGGPGSGKSYVAQQLFGIPETINVSTYGLKMVNQDQELELFLNKFYGPKSGADSTVDYLNIQAYPPELFKQLTDPNFDDYAGLRGSAKYLSRKRMAKYLEGRLGVIIDGTGHKYNAIKKERQDLLDLGYDTYMVFVTTSLEVAQQRNESRPRRLPADLVEKSWKKVMANMAYFQGLFGNANFMIVDNNKHLTPEEAKKKFKMLVEKGIKKFIKRPIRSKIAKKWIQQQKLVPKQDLKQMLGK